MARPRKQTYTLEMYLKKNMKGDIDNKADVQRNFAWNKEQINEIVATVLTDDYIPPIILGEEPNSKLHIVDGGCRTAALIKFRYMNYKITSSIENSQIHYKKKVIDEYGSNTYEEAVFDIKNKTFDKLPEELKEKFDEYQIETVIHEGCDSYIISRYIKRYNNHVSMNIDQKAFTYIDKFASRIREILDSRFFVDCSCYSEKDKNKGVVERVVVETMMCMNHFDNWKTQPKPAFKYLNEHATNKEFDAFADNLYRLENIITEDIKTIFNKKDSFVFLTLFDRFTRLGVDDIRFADFLRVFNTDLRGSRKNDKGLLFDEIDKEVSTKDKQVIVSKLALLESLLLEFLHIQNSDDLDQTVVDFITGVLDIDSDTIKEDIDVYNEDLDSLLKKVKGSKLNDSTNRLSLLAMMVYSYKEDVNLDDWFVNYAKRATYYADQEINFLHMKNDFDQWLVENKQSA